MMKRRILQTLITMGLFLLAWQGIRYLATTVPEFDNVLWITLLIIGAILVCATAGLAITRMIDDYDKKHDGDVPEEPVAPPKFGKKKKK